MHIILGDNYIDYYDALDTLNCDTLVSRRVKLCEKYARKASKSTKYRNWFTLKTTAPSAIYTRQNKKEFTKYLPVQTGTCRYKNFPLPYLTYILNKNTYCQAQFQLASSS